MSRSLKKGPYVFHKLVKKIAGKNPASTAPIKTWARASQIAPEMVGFKFLVHTGKAFEEVLVTEEMVGHRFGEFAATTKFLRHGGQMQKALDEQKKQSEIAAASAAKAAASEGKTAAPKK